MPVLAVKWVHMEHAKAWGKNAWKYLRKNWFIFFALAIYTLAIANYMGPGFTQCSDSIYGFGDSTAGPIWRNSLKPDQPIFGGYENSTNYPKGESLYSPVNFAVSFQSIAMNIGSKFVGPVCAYNIYNIVGYLTTAFVIFGFVFYLTKKRWIALLAGYAVAFPPYVQGKVGAHPSYGYVAVLAAILWLTIHLLTYRKNIHAVLLAVLLALCAYLDPYFVLLALTVIVPTFLVWLWFFIMGLKQKSSKQKKQEWRSLIRPVLVAGVVFLVLISPILAIRIKDAKLIDATVSGARGNIVAAAMLCSNNPLDYVLPDPTNIFFVELFGVKYTQANISLRNWCGYAESRVSLSLTLLCVVAFAFIVWSWEKLNKRRIGMGKFVPYNTKLLLGTFIAVGCVAVLVGLPPTVHGVTTPSGWILSVTAMWRIFAREFLVVNMVLVLVASLSLAYFANSLIFKNREKLKWIVWLIIFLGILVEYQINRPFSPMTFSYSRDVPSIYQTVKSDPNIKVIAEYPIDKMGLEYDSIVYYLTMQGVHGKKLFNSALSSSPDLTEQLSLRDLTDPQTLPALRSLGIEYVVVHGVSREDLISQLGDKIEILGHDNPPVYALTMVRGDVLKDMFLIKIKNGPKISDVIVLEKGLIINFSLMRSPIGMEYEVSQDALLRVTPLSQMNKSSSRVCFQVKMSAQDDADDLVVSINDTPTQTVHLNGGVYTDISDSVKDGDTIRLHTTSGRSIRLNNLNMGCE